jgi:hypothetical protein
MPSTSLPSSTGPDSRCRSGSVCISTAWTLSLLHAGKLMLMEVGRSDLAHRLADSSVPYRIVLRTGSQQKKRSRRETSDHSFRCPDRTTGRTRTRHPHSGAGIGDVVRSAIMAHRRGCAIMAENLRSVLRVGSFAF